ncbi:MAG: sulfite exporter TauE/SafE family protein [Flavobacteriales bacterium]|nr:MAG: sulfite exporter TauE/SafE family protein [Flavobacteriales bacterium]
MEVAIISLVAFLAAILTFFSGFGLGTILTPIMMIYFPVEIAVAFTGIVHFSNNIFKLFIVGNKANKEVLVKFGLPAIFAAFIGSYFLFNMNTEYIIYSYNLLGQIKSISLVKFIVSLLLIVFASFDLIPFFKKLEFGKKSLPIGGLLSGFFGGLSGNQGALRSSFLIKLSLDKETFIATTVVISTMVDFTRLGVYSSNLLQINLEDYLTLGVSSILAATLGAFIGNKLLKKITLDYIRILVATLVLLLAFGLLLGVI